MVRYRQTNPSILNDFGSVPGATTANPPTVVTRPRYRPTNPDILNFDIPPIPAPAPPISTPSADQRFEGYQQQGDRIVTTGHRLAPEQTPDGEQDCAICAYSKPLTDFPDRAVAAACDHRPTACRECIARSIQEDLTAKAWAEGVVKCPECSAPLKWHDVEKYADKQTFDTYMRRVNNDTFTTFVNFIFCTAAGCDSGQIHESGSDQPIVTCNACGHRTCFHHKIAWHHEYTCIEWDMYKADPTFKTQRELENEAAQAEIERRAQQEADDLALARSMEAEEREEERRLRELQRKQEEEKRRQQREEEKRKAEAKRLEALRKMKEEELSESTVIKTTKPCPGCKRPIEKNKGCSHMTCTQCRYEWCWACNAQYTRSHNNYCNGRG